MNFSKTAALIASFALISAFLAAPRAQQPPQPQPAPAQAPAQGQPPAQGAQPPAAAPQAKPFIPLAASTLVKNPKAYYGEMITVTAPVEQTLSKTSFSVDQDKTKSMQEVLVVAPTMTGTVDVNSYVTVIGELMPFDAAEIAKKAKGYTLDISPEMAAKYKGQPVVLATAVVNSAGIDVARKPIPPPTADDLALSKLMKQVGPANTALRGDIDKMDAAVTKERAVLLKQMFTQTEAFWKAKGKAEPTQLAHDAMRDAEALEAAATAGNWDQARTAAGSLAQKCGGCHRTYREAMDDGTFRIKAGS